MKKCEHCQKENPVTKRYCISCGKKINGDTLMRKEKETDTYSYKGWLVSDSIIKRSLAVVGHNYFAMGLLVGVITVIYLILYLLYLFADMLGLA